MSGINATSNFNVSSDIWNGGKHTSTAKGSTLSESKTSNKADGTYDSVSTSIDATFKLALRKEAIQYTDLEKRTHDLLGYVVKGFQETMEVGTEISFASLFKGGSQGQTLSDSLIGTFTSFAAARSITHEYTSNQAFANSYSTSSTSALDQWYVDLKRNMENISVAKDMDGEVEIKVSNSAYMMDR